MSEHLGRLESRIEYVFSDKNLLLRALRHRSSNQSGDGNHMERLEFLGDAVLGLVISEYLHHHFPDKQEGDLSRMRAALVRKESLLVVAGFWDLVSYLNVGDSERLEKGRGGKASPIMRIKSPSISANAVEAVIGAVFEDGGWPAAHKLVREAWQQLLIGVDALDARDAKSRLQEFTQSKGWGLPEYTLTDRGAGHSPRFGAICRVNSDMLGEGHGDRKKIAEIKAAEQAWQHLKK
ncbi:MAG: ribonuclease III [Mariprofundus sp.]|nr:ribonuclease III [Mariprofundus sp.]